MSEIRVPVTAPGATQAANELRGVAGAAANVGKAEEQAAKGADRLARAHAAATKATVTRTNATMAQARALAAAARAEEAADKSSGRNGTAFAALGRGGGVAGGVLGRIGGGLGSSSLGGLGPLAAGAAVAGLALMKLSEVSAHNVERATALAKAFADMSETVRNARKQAGANAASAFGENEQVLRRLIASGVPLSEVANLARASGPDAPEALAAQQSNYSDRGHMFGAGDVALKVSQTLRRLGVTSSLMEGMKQLPEDRVRNAINGGGGADQLLREIIGESQGGAPISQDVLKGMIGRINAGAQILDRNTGIEGGFRAARLGVAGSLAGGDAIMAERASWMNPVAAAVSETNRKMEEQLKVLEAGAKAQAGIHALLQDCSASGSLNVQVLRAQNDYATVQLGSTY